MNAFSAAMLAYQQLAQDRSYASRVKKGRMQLVRVTYGADGRSTVTECSPWIKVSQWLDYMTALCADDQQQISAIELAN